ncbi:hypothetical protein ACJX0J_039856, partial [Zea mays]
SPTVRTLSLGMIAFGFFKATDKYGHGWMEQALIIQDYDRNLALKAPQYTMEKDNMFGLKLIVTFELAAMYPNLKGFGPSFLNMFSDIKLGCEKLRSIIMYAIHFFV